MKKAILAFFKKIKTWSAPAHKLGAWQGQANNPILDASGNVMGLGIYNVQNYGADSTGVADSTAAFNAAFAAAQTAGGGTVYAPSGTYNIAGWLNFSQVLEAGSGILLLGQTQTGGVGHTPRQAPIRFVSDGAGDFAGAVQSNDPLDVNPQYKGAILNMSYNGGTDPITGVATVAKMETRGFGLVEMTGITCVDKPAPMAGTVSCSTTGAILVTNGATVGTVSTNGLYVQQAGTCQGRPWYEYTEPVSGKHFYISYTTSFGGLWQVGDGTSFTTGASGGVVGGTWGWYAVGTTTPAGLNYSGTGGGSGSGAGTPVLDVANYVTATSPIFTAAMVDSTMILADATQHVILAYIGTSNVAVSSTFSGSQACSISARLLFFQTTNTSVHIHGNMFVGDVTQRQANNSQITGGYGWWTQDAIRLGGTTVATDMTAAAAFQGYVSIVEHNFFHYTRECVRGGVYSNNIIVRDNAIADDCGSYTGIAGVLTGGNVGPIHFGASTNGCVSTGNCIEMTSYEHGIVLDNCLEAVCIGDSFWDWGNGTDAYLCVGTVTATLIPGHISEAVAHATAVAGTLTGITYLALGNARFGNLPTSNTGLATGQFWNNSGVLSIK